jgi:predicted ATPase
MIIGLCGTHGTGKTTVLQAAKEAGFKVDETQLSRAAQAALGWDRLSRAQESVENMWALQDAILEAMYDRDENIRKSGELTVVERTPADVWAYTAMWCQRLMLDVRDQRVAFYKAQCRNMSNSYTRFVLVPPVEAIPFVEEPNRADIESRNFVAHEINAFLWDGLLPTHFMQAISREARKAEIVMLCTIEQQKRKIRV